MYCTNCGEPMQDNANFCTSCGARAADFQHDSAAQSRRPSRRRYGSEGVAETRIYDSLVDDGTADREGGDLLVTVFEGSQKLQTVPLRTSGKTTMTFGASKGCDLQISSSSNTVSRHHGTFELRDGRWLVHDDGSTNGVFVNGRRYRHRAVGPGDVITIGKPRPGRRSVALVMGRDVDDWSVFELHGRPDVTIGRSRENALVLPHSTVSAFHAVLERRSEDMWTIHDRQSYNGVLVGGEVLDGSATLELGVPVMLGSATLIHLDGFLLYSTARRGVELSAMDLVQRRKAKGGERITTDHVSLHIGKGQFVAIVGGSGSGKSTLLNALNGSDMAVEGTVLVDGVELYRNYDKLKNSIGYVPQQDIVYDNLSLVDMLDFAAEMRMPPDTTPQERTRRIDEVIELLELDGVRDNKIHSMSGGQKKRASIAVEMLADPQLFFLDEPTSGLDPGIERSLMQKLAAMAHDGRTIVLVTHTTLNLHLCDQVVFLGAGGKLCYAGPPSAALSFFGVEDFVDVYNRISEDPGSWAGRFATTHEANVDAPTGREEAPESDTPPFGQQLRTLVKRSSLLLFNDRTRLLLLLLQAPLLGALICIVAGDGCFSEYEGTKSCLFAMSCAAFWVGVLDAIQEICKERSIFLREHAGGMKVSAYVMSKVAVLGVLSAVQSLLLVGVFLLIKSAPAEGVMTSAAIELYVSTFLITFSAVCLGLLVSALFTNPDRAIAMAPLLIMPQILFSGLVFKLEGATKAISNVVNCRWGMEAYGTTANLNDLDLSLYGEEISIPAMEGKVIDKVTTDIPSFDTTVKIDGLGKQEVTVPTQKNMELEDVKVDVPAETDTIDSDMYQHDYESMFEFATGHLLASWGILLLFCIVCIVACCAVTKYKARRG